MPDYTCYKMAEEIAQQYINGSPEVRKTILNFFETEDETQTFMQYVGFFEMFTSENYYKKIRDLTLKSFVEDLKKQKTA